MPNGRTAKTLALTALVAMAAACQGSASVLDPAGPRAALIADLTWLMLAIATAVFVIVMLLLGWAVWRGRRGSRPSRLGRLWLVVAGGIVLPVVVLPSVYVASLLTMSALFEPGEETALEVDVVAFQWGYRATYPNGASLTDQVRIPAGEPVLLRLRSEDVIHSFWVPRVAGKQDFIPGRVNELWIEASEAGIYEGRCAEFCGIGHARMEFALVALPPVEFEAWLRDASP